MPTLNQLTGTGHLSNVARTAPFRIPFSLSFSTHVRKLTNPTHEKLPDVCKQVISSAIDQVLNLGYTEFRIV